ncbi:unnamed protein product, partial [marine sediment metagenome]
NLVQEGESLIEPVNFSGPNAIVSASLNGDGEEERATARFAFDLLLRYSAGKAGDDALVRIS